MTDLGFPFSRLAHEGNHATSRHHEAGLPGAAQRPGAGGHPGSSAYERSCPLGAAGPPTTAGDELQAVGAQEGD